MINIEALQPLYKPWEEPTMHRGGMRLEGGAQACLTPGRRPSRARLVPALRHAVKMFRESAYSGASETSRTLLQHWFATAHAGDFRYHFAQREAIETIVWLYEVARYRTLSSMCSELLDNESADFVTLLHNISEDDDTWARYCCKIATGGGKTKVMSLAIVWSYFHRKFEAGSDLAQHFVAVAPNLTVFERLKDDFAPSDGASIFYRDPLLPPEWKDDFDLQVVLQDDPGGAATSGALYLTNIHRLYSSRDERGNGSDESPSWAGPAVSRAQALQTGEALRQRISSHPCVIVLNDEAHHLHDSELAWNDALASLHRQSKTRGNAGILAQLDFTATPKHNDGTLFHHIVCDFPLGEAVDAGIVKVPVIGKSDALTQNSAAGNAFEEYRTHLLLGYQQYERAYKEWEKTHKPILFVMTEDTTKANEIWKTLNDDDRFPLLRGKCINLHTRLKGKIKHRRRGNVMVAEFEEDEKDMKPDELKELRQLSRDLDKPDSPYRCVISVLMLREGWDVRNVTTIIPLRPYSAASNILAEQTLGRGLRRMTSAVDGPEEYVTVVDHEAFAKLYREELSQEGLDIAIEEIDRIPPQTVSIFVDGRKDVAALEIELPEVSDAVNTTPVLEGLDFEQIRTFFTVHYGPLPVLEPGNEAITFEERTLFSDELVASWNIDRGLLSTGPTSVSVFVKELERACRLQNAHAVLAPLIQRFIEEVLFERKVNLYSGEVNHRMADSDVTEHIRATFTPLILQRTVTHGERTRSRSVCKLSGWKAYQATSSPTRPCIPAANTLFNLVPCDRGYEREFVDFCDVADDVAAFAKNAGPQKLMIDYLGPVGRPALYAPDFFVRLKNGQHFLVETKGQVDQLVARKAQAAVEWTRTASTKDVPWEYLYAPMAIFTQMSEPSVAALARACRPSLESLLDTLRSQQTALTFEETPAEIRDSRMSDLLKAIGAAELPAELSGPVQQALDLLAFQRDKNFPQYGSSFQPLLAPFEELSGKVVRQRLAPKVPHGRDDQRYYFEPYTGGEDTRVQNLLRKNQRFLQKNLVYGDTCNRIGVLLFCIEYATKWDTDVGGIWADVADAFASTEFEAAFQPLADMYAFRNKHVAHVAEPLTDPAAAEEAMRKWVAGLVLLRALAGASGSGDAGHHASRPAGY